MHHRNSCVHFQGDRPDFIAKENQTEKIWAIETKLIKQNRAGTAQFRGIVELALRANETVRADAVLIIISADVNKEQVERVIRDHKQLTIWFRQDIESLLEKHPKVLKHINTLINSIKEFEVVETPQIEVSQPLQELQQRFHNTPLGQAGWRAYEDLCIDALKELFTPPLNPPHIQPITEDGLDRRDAVFSWSQSHRFWDVLGVQFRTRLIVAEFKNYTHAIAQTEVEALRDYLYVNAMRNVGILCSRHEPSESAFKARRRAWQESQKLILFVSDANFLEMIARKQECDDVTKFLDDQIDQFFMYLNA